MAVERRVGGNGVPSRAPGSGPSPTNGAGDPAAVLERLRTRLLDLTLLNRLLNFKQTSPRVVRVIDELPDQLFERLRTGAELEILPVPEPPKDHPLRVRAKGAEKAARAATSAAYAAELGLAVSFDLPQPENGSLAPKHCDDAIQTLLFPTDLEKVLRALAADARSALEEKGSNILYLSFGFLEWYESESSEKAILSPLVMLPVSIRRGEPDRKTGAYRFYVTYADEDVLPNLSLQEKLRRDFRLALPDLEDDDTPEAYLARLTKTVPLFPRWTIRRHVSLGLLAFTKLFMYRDLDPKMWPAGAGPVEHPRVAELLGAGDGDAASEAAGGDVGYHGEYDFEGGGAGPTPPIVPPIVIDADSSQHSALVDAFAGKSLVVEGPPGTGKSQTIANLIAAAMDAGKSVLFVAEKLTALEVVRRRLDEVGLGPFCLELHSDKTQKSVLMEDLKRRLDLRRTFRPPATLDERARVLLDSRKRLNSYARRINARIEPIGWTVHDVLWGTERRRSLLGAHADRWKKVAVPSLESITLSGYEELRRSAHAFGEALAQVRRAGPLGSHPFWGIWTSRTDPAFETDLLGTLEPLRDKAQEAVARLAALDGEFGSACPPSIAALEALRLRVDALDERAQQAVLAGAATLATPGARRELSDWSDQLAAYLDATRALEAALPDAEARRLLFDLPATAFDDVAPSTPVVRVAELSDLAQAAKAETQAARALVGRLSRAAEVNVPPMAAAALMAHDVAGCAARAPFDVLAYRTRPDDDVDALLETAHRRHADLTREIADLEAQFQLASLPDAATLDAHTASCATAGFFAFLSSAYRGAKRQLLILQREPKPMTNAERAAAFRTLAAYTRNRDAFENDAALKALLGTSFRGLETPFDKILAARAWQREAVALQRRHRRMMGAFTLATASADLLHDLAALGGTAKSPADVFARTRAVLELRPTPSDSEGASLAEMEAGVDETVRLLDPLRGVLLRLRGRLPPSVGEVQRLCDQTRSLAASRERLESAEAVRAALRESFAGVATPLPVARATHAYANALFDAQTPETLRAYLRRRPAPDFRDRLVVLLDNARRALVAMYAAEDAFRTTGAVELGHWYGKDDPRPAPSVVLTRTIRALTERHTLATWAAYLRARIAIYRGGGDFLREVVEGDEQVDLATLATAAEFAVHSNHAARSFARDPELAHHEGVSHSSLRDQFRRYDEEVMRLERERMAARIDGRPVPEGARGSLVKSLTDLALLEHELRKQKRHIPIRQLVNRAGGALRALKPCFMMSPRSVAQYLEAGVHTFDLVIMDEASQLRPEDAIGAVVRGKQLVVVGDSKQLPPTSFFTSESDGEVSEEEEENEAVTDNKESILDLARTVFRSVRRLRWHYRSRHGSLIAFSNERYYNGDLIVFPSAHEATDDQGVRLVHVENAIYADGENPVEAQAVVDAILEHLRTRPEVTLGIVALNIRQKALIQEALYERFKDEQELRQRFERAGLTDPGFIKNLESVQGDERDVIYISVTYGPSSPGGPVARRFGPINSETGWRRLNVLFTRAKRQVVVFSSFAPEELKEEGLSRGAKDLRDYIAFARAGAYQTGHESGREPDSDFEIAVADVARGAGYAVTPQVGVAGYFVDLAVRRRDRSGPYLLGIECDGAPYHSSFSARDRDRLRQQVLEGLGWKIHRIWSTDWYCDPRTQALRMLEAIRHAELGG